MSFQTKRPPTPSSPVARPSTAPPGTGSLRPSNIRDARLEAHAVGGGAVSRPSALARPAGRKTGLRVDADPEARARLRSLLEADYQVVEARDGLEAIELLGTIGILAMVVSDTALPQMDGFALAKVLRANPMTKRVPIMFVSNQNDAQHVKQALVIGVSHYLPKTTPVMAIVEKVRKIVV